MLRWRLPIGIALIASLLGLFALDVRIGPSAPLLCVFAVLLAIRGAWEMVQLLKTRSFAPKFELVAACCALVVFSSWVGWYLESDRPLMLSVALATVALFIAAARSYRAPGQSMETLGAELLIVLYIGLFLGLASQMRWIGSVLGVGDLGYLPLASVIVVTKCGDTMAYTFGHLFGKKKLAPLLSPGKTWAGAYGALIGATAGAWAWLNWGTKWLAPDVQPCAWYWAMVYGLIIGLAGMVGDLCESLIKRDVGVKDSAPLLPGFGGVLDLLDSVIFAGPVAYLLWLVLPLVR